MAAFKEDSSAKVGGLGPSAWPDWSAATCGRRSSPHYHAANSPQHNNSQTAGSTICTAGVETAGRPSRGGDAETG
jgi:hypothetical protein